MIRSFSTLAELQFYLASSFDLRFELADKFIRGLMLTKRKNGTPQWVLKYKSPSTLKDQRFAIGSYVDVTLYEARQVAMTVIRQEYAHDTFDFVPDGVLLGENSYSDCVQVSERFDSRQDDFEHGLDNGSPGPSNNFLISQFGNNPKISHLESVRGSANSVRNPLTLHKFYLEHYLPFIKVAKRSWRIDVSILTNHVFPLLGGYNLLDVKPYLIQEMLNTLSNKGLSASSANRALIIVRFMFNNALKWDVIPKISNPCDGIKELTLNNKKERYLTTEEVVLLRAELKKSRNVFLPFLIQLLILTGCRRGEAINAKIMHIDLARGDWIVPLPKGGKTRHIPLNQAAIDTVRATIQLKLSLNQASRESVFLFPSPNTGEPFKQIFFSWDKARKAAGLKEVRMHDLRHSFASALVNSGMTLYDVKEILGHTNIKTTERYAHLNNARLKAASSSVMSFYGDETFQVYDKET